MECSSHQFLAGAENPCGRGVLWRFWRIGSWTRSSFGRRSAHSPDCICRGPHQRRTSGKTETPKLFDLGGSRTERIATALLECVGLLPRQRRVFVSYRRDDARQAALQLFNALSARLFDVFLDTHGIAPAEDFQAVLWHRLCDSDVLVMLDTPGYFESRWTNAEYGRALAKGISVLRIGWPGVSPSLRTATASRLDLAATEIDCNDWPAGGAGNKPDLHSAGVCAWAESRCPQPESL